MLDGRVREYCEVALGMACRNAEGVAIETLDLRLSRDLNDSRERAEILRQVLDVLVSDAYVVRQQGTVRFRSALLRRYWLEVRE